MERTWHGRIFEELEIFRERVELQQVTMLSDQQVFRFIVGTRKFVDDIADVCADSEIAGAADIDRNTHRSWRSPRCAGTPCQGGRDIPASIVERKLHRKFSHFGANAALPLGVAEMRKH